MNLTPAVDINALPFLLTPDEAAQVLRIPRSTVYDLAARGEIPRVKLGRTVRIPKAALIERLSDLSGTAPSVESGPVDCQDPESTKAR